MEARVLKFEAEKPAAGCTSESSAIPSSSEETIAEKKSLILKNIGKNLNLKKVPLGELASSQWRIKIQDTVKGSVAEEFPMAAAEEAERITREILDEILGLGPIESFIKDPEISEIMINGRAKIYVEKRGKLFLSGKTFSSDEMILSMLDRILAPLGRRIDTSSPTVDARLKDGSRVHAIIHPLSVIGPVVTIRKFSAKLLTMEDLIKLEAISGEAAPFMIYAVERRKNIIVSGGTGSGKTTMLNILSTAIKPSERIVIIEDSSELKLPQEHTIYLETRPPNIEGKGEVTIRDLVRNSLRMRPDRIVVGECRGGEAIDMLQAMNTGHDGCMTTLHSNSPRDTLSRLETMALMSGLDLPIKAIRDQIASAVDIIIHLSRISDGRRMVTSITEVCGNENSIITTQELFSLSSSKGTSGCLLVPTGNIPKFFDR